MEKESPQKQTISLRQLRDRALRELLPRMLNDIMDTPDEMLAQYHYLLQTHLENWIDLRNTVVLDENGCEVTNIAGAMVSEIWDLKNG